MTQRAGWPPVGWSMLGSPVDLGKIHLRCLIAAESPITSARGSTPTASSSHALGSKDNRFVVGHQRAHAALVNPPRKPQGVIPDRAVDPEGPDDAEAVAGLRFEAATRGGRTRALARRAQRAGGRAPKALGGDGPQAALVSSSG